MTQLFEIFHLYIFLAYIRKTPHYKYSRSQNKVIYFSKQNFNKILAVLFCYDFVVF